MTARLITLLIAAMASAAIQAGCGGGDDDGSDSASAGDSATAASNASLGKDEFVEKATEICRRERQDLIGEVVTYSEKNPPDPKSSQGEEAIETFKAVQLPIIESELAQLRELGAPKGGEADVEAFLIAEQKAVDSASKLSGSSSADSMQARFTAAAKLAEAASIPKCGNSALITG